MEASNVQKMREALFLFVHDFASFRKDVEHGILHMMQCMDFVKEFIPLMESALSAPPRQCDVGTPNEQYERYRNTASYMVYDFTLANALHWAQMPYTEEEGGAE